MADRTSTPQPQCPVCNAFIAAGTRQCRNCLTEFDNPDPTPPPSLIDAAEATLAAMRWMAQRGDIQIEGVPYYEDLRDAAHAYRTGSPAQPERPCAHCDGTCRGRSACIRRQGIAAGRSDERESVVLYGRGYASGWDGEGERAVNAFIDDIAKGVHLDV